MARNSSRQTPANRGLRTNQVHREPKEVWTTPLGNRERKLQHRSSSNVGPDNKRRKTHGKAPEIRPKGRSLGPGGTRNATARHIKASGKSRRSGKNGISRDSPRGVSKLLRGTLQAHAGGVGSADGLFRLEGSSLIKDKPLNEVMCIVEVSNQILGIRDAVSPKIASANPDGKETKESK